MTEQKDLLADVIYLGLVPWTERPLNQVQG